MIEEVHIRQIEDNGDKHKGLAKITIVCDEAYSKMIMAFINQIMDVSEATKGVFENLAKIAGMKK